MNTIRLCLSDIFEQYNKIIIPDIQRDYVMGSGGEKLKRLFEAMSRSVKKDERFNFSCLVGYKDNDNNLYIYDGQQRLATLVCLCSYSDTDKELYKKFIFTSRNKANEWIQNTNEINENDAVDFTTYSFSKLIKMFESSCIESKYQRYKPCDILSIDFLKKQIVFDMILVNKISDAEQFFLDINDGLDLKYYEIFKAELYHHANSVLKGEFKKFALKMENEWLKFFLQYRHSEDKWINGQKQNVVHHVEEEMLVFYLQYCFRTMWIEENGDDKKYLPLDVWWLKKEHFNRVEEITDFIIKRNTNSNNKKSWISYSIKDQGQHWNIKDNHYNEMLHVFLRNLYNTKEINKDVIIWCYISNCNSKEWLSDYLRLVKKLLNNNRKENINATIYFKNWGIEHKEIVYARYYVQEIPKYYLESGVCEKYDQEILFDIIKMNKKISLNHNCLEFNDCLEIMYKECENELKVRSLLEKERKKLHSPDCKKIEEYENLPFINGLVDNFIEYKEQLCQLKDWAKNDETLTVLKNTNSKGYQYRDILKYICKNKIDIDNCKIKNVNIQWKAYTGTKYCDKGTILIHTWCDLFTNKNGIKFSNEDNRHKYFGALPEGWINNENYIVQPDDNKYTNSEYPKSAFAANNQKSMIFNLTNIFVNFSSICKSKEDGKYLIKEDGERNSSETSVLPDYLNNYNGEGFIIKWISDTKETFYSDKEYLNKILLYMFKSFRESKKEDIDTYLKKQKDRMQFEIMDNRQFFIKLKEI